MGKLKDLTKEEFVEIVNNSNSITDFLRNINYTNVRSAHTRNAFLKRVEKENVDISHFSQHYNKSGQAHNVTYTLEEILIENSTYTNIACLKSRILKENLLEYKCDECNNTGEWNGKPLALQLDHKNGVNNDHRLENLRFLCPNCHSQTETFSGKNSKKDLTNKE